MNARTLKEWTVSSGDFERSKDTDYESKFKSARSHKKDFEKKVVLAFSISGLLMVLLMLELITRF